jgi:hypothetical protein
MTPREFRQEKEFEFDRFIELTSTGISPNYVNIELFAQEYHKAKLNLLTIPVVVKSLPQDNYCNVCKLPTDGEKCYSKRCPV